MLYLTLCKFSATFTIPISLIFFYFICFVLVRTFWMSGIKSYPLPLVLTRFTPSGGISSPCQKKYLQVFVLFRIFSLSIKDPELSTNESLTNTTPLSPSPEGDGKWLPVGNGWPSATLLSSFSGFLSFSNILVLGFEVSANSSLSF